MRLFVDNLTNVDFSYLCPDRGVVGETWLASLELGGELDEQGMVCDFGHVKKHMRNWLDDTLDHTLLVPTAHPHISVEGGPGQSTIRLNSPGQQITCCGPAQAFALIDAPRISPETVSGWCIQQLKGDFGTGVQQIVLDFAAEDIDGPYYHYSHGLKKHLGNCQRIAHGHRSRILIWKDGQLDKAAMHAWAERWRDIYLGTEEDIVDETPDTLTFAYRAQQGDFQLQIPRRHCHLMPTDTTVEHIAQHIADRLLQESPGHKFVIKAFEGVGKGAIARAG